MNEHFSERDISKNPAIAIIDVLRASMVEVLVQVAAVEGRVEALENGRRGGTMVNGKPAATVNEFLIELGVKVPDGTFPGEERSFYSLVGMEFKKIAEKLGKSVNDVTCPSMRSRESKYWARFYPREWLEEIAPIWIKCNRGNPFRKQWFRNVR